MKIKEKTLRKINIILKKNSIAIYLVLLTVVILFAYGVLLTAPKNFIFGESNGFWNYGNILIKHNLLKYGQVGLWDSQVGLGYSFIGHQTAQFYPLVWLSYLISDSLMPIRVLGIAHLILGGLAFFYLLKTLKCNNLCSFLGSIIYICNTYVLSVVVNGIYAEIYSLIWMPLSVAFLFKALFYKEKFFAIFSGISLSMQIFAMTLFCFTFNAILLALIIIFYFAYSLFKKENFLNTTKYTLLIFFLLFGTTIGVSAIKLMPILEYKNLSMRDFLPYNENWNFATVKILADYLNTRLISINNPTDIQKFVNFSFLSLLVLSLFKKSKEAVCFIFVSIVVFLTLMGPNAKIDLYFLFYYLVPGFKFNENTFRFIIILNVTLSVLVGLGAQFLYSKAIRKGSRALVIGLVIIIISQAAVFTNFQMNGYVKSDAIYKMVNSDKNNLAEKISKLTHKEQGIVRVASAYIGGVNAIGDYQALVYDFRLTNPLYSDFVPTYQYFPQIITPNVDKEFLRKKYKFLALMSAKYIVAQKEYDDFPNDYISPVFAQDGGSVYEMKSFLPYVSEIPKAILLVGEDDFRDFKAFEAKVLMLDEKFDLTWETILTSPKTHLEDFSLDDLKKFDSIILSNTKIINIEQFNKLLTAYKESGGKVLKINFNQNLYKDLRKRSSSILGEKPAKWLSLQDSSKYQELLSDLNSNRVMLKSTVTLKEYNPERIQISVDNPNKKIFLRISESYFPGWHAFEKGKEIPIYMSDGLVKGLIISGQGKHTILLTYSPDSFRFGSIITGATSILLVFIFLLVHRKRNSSYPLS